MKILLWLYCRWSEFRWWLVIKLHRPRWKVRVRCRIDDDHSSIVTYYGQELPND